MDTEVQQPALVTTCLAMDAALRARGISPDVVVGHSVGEFSALGSARSLSARDAIALVRDRGIAMAEAARLHPGSMAAILGLADEAVEALCRKISNVWPANYNCPGQLVISGETPSVDEACVEAEREGARRAVKLRVSGAFHTPLVARAAEVLRPAVERVHLAEGRATFMSTVTARVEDAKRLVDEAGGIDVLVNNAGLTRDGLLARMSGGDCRTVLDTNLSSVFYTCRAVTRPMMKRRGGSIVNISSVVGMHGNWGQTDYAASKAGIIGFTKSLARELGSRHIRANDGAPGCVKPQLP